MNDTWTTKDGRVIPIDQMDDDHLVNAMNMVARKAKTRKDGREDAAWSAAFSFQGEMASYVAEQEADALSRLHWTEYLPEIWWKMRVEAQKRGLKVDEQ